MVLDLRRSAITASGLGGWRTMSKHKLPLPDRARRADAEPLGRTPARYPSHLPFRRRERAMVRFRQMKTLQKFTPVHANVHNHFDHERHLVDRQTYKERRSVAQAEWRNLASQAPCPIARAASCRERFALD